MINVTDEAAGAIHQKGPGRVHPSPGGPRTRAPLPRWGPRRVEPSPGGVRDRAGESGWLPRKQGYLTEPAVMPATRKRCSSRKPTTIGTLTVSDAAMIWFQ